MFTTPSYELTPWQDGMLWCHYLAEEEHCPKCGNILVERDRRKRRVRYCGGEKNFIIVRRMYCPVCKRLHVELPDKLLPYKQYEADVIESVVDGTLDENDPETIDGPTKLSMELWIAWLNNILQHFSELYSLAIQTFQNPLPKHFSQELPASLATLREYGAGWLSTGIFVVYNSGFML